MQLDLVTIPAGAFTMGADDGQPDERPVRRVWVDEFALAVHPVTNADYERFVAATGHAAPGTFAEPRFAHPLQPVVAVTWFDAVAYCAWLRAATGRPCRLPTEAEREKAALGGVDGRRYPWGDDAEIDARAPRLLAPPPVGADRGNGYGLRHLGDLVHEWCSDWYDAGYYRSAPLRNPAGPPAGTRRSSRGGSWRHRLPVSRCAARSSLPPDRSYEDYGFRVAVGAH